MWKRSLIALLAFLVTRFSANAESPEYKLKAAFLFNFAKFVTWPEAEFAAQPKVILCLVGEDPFGTDLSILENRPVQGRPLTIRRAVKAADLKTCHAAFFADSARDQIPALLKTLGDAPVLTVGEGDRFCGQGGMISLLSVNQKIQFEVNVDAAQQAGLRMNAQMLKLAAAIHGGRR
jgi:YfiR/HmsC-like